MLLVEDVAGDFIAAFLGESKKLSADQVATAGDGGGGDDFELDVQGALAGHLEGDS